jgi:predicted MFS family arabinose efflux permease
VEGVRCANIGIAVGAVIILGGAAIFRHSETAVQVVGFIGFCAALAVTIVLLDREQRRKGRDPQ